MIQDPVPNPIPKPELRGCVQWPTMVDLDTHRVIYAYHLGAWHVQDVQPISLSLYLYL